MAPLSEVATFRIGNRRFSGKDAWELIKRCFYRECDGELLPAGTWPRQASAEASGQRAEPAAPKTLDYSRFRFLRSLTDRLIGPRRSIDFRGLGGKYLGFIVRAASGAEIALLDAEETGNALYIFRAGHPEWEAEAQKTRHEVWSGKHPAYIRKIHHSGDWQQRVENLLAAN